MDEKLKDKLNYAKKIIESPYADASDFKWMIQTIEQQREKLDFWKSYVEELLKVEKIHIKQLQEKDKEIKYLEGKLKEKFPFVKSPIRVIEFSECEHQETKVEKGIEYCDVCGLIFNSNKE